MPSQLCVLSYEQLNELSGRLFTLAEFTLANRQAAADMRMAARGLSDLATLRCAILNGATADELLALAGGRQ